MVCFIIVAKEKKKREAYVKEYANNHKVNTFDITLLERDTTKSALSIGIETIKSLQKNIFLKPIGNTSKIVHIEDAHLLTPEAQNALLKVLEEPPANTYIFLCTETTEALLPTILSRCQIIQLEEKQKEISEKTREEITHFITTLPNLSIGERLKYAEQLAKDKDKAIIWLENVMLIMREQLLASYNDSHLAIQTDNIYLLRSFQKLLIMLKTTNVNPRFAIENTLL
ncbi:MAG TPA: hypothetical protein VNW29_02700 [Candidatus Sulfotelmatobacter sp.]|jgi:DNA polymerase III delta prime subunit|nr:hypothetical protein [Candidatus Sulfotelmatobacter sp.]